jgi:D-alanyl-D-alanine carboxypeptidase
MRYFSEGKSEGRLALSTSVQLTQNLQNVFRTLTSKKQIKHAIAALESGDGSFRWTGVSGDAQSGGEPMQENTPYNIASVTKIYIGAAIMKLAG